MVELLLAAGANPDLQEEVRTSYLVNLMVCGTSEHEKSYGLVYMYVHCTSKMYLKMLEN